MRKYYLLLFAAVLLFACRQKKKKVTLSGEDRVELTDFVNFFKQVNLPFVYSDANLQQKESDSLLISAANFNQFIPDSIIKSIYDKTTPKIYGLGKTGTTSGESYYFVKTSGAGKNALIILALDKSDKFIASLKALVPDNNPNTMQSVTLDRRSSITQTVQLKNKDGSVSEGKDVYTLNAAANSFTLIMTDQLADQIELINPIDTLPRKSKWSADYSSEKNNLVSIRDGRHSDLIEFFIHFNKNNGRCTGEMKGEAKMKTANTAEYREEGDPCILKFIFSANSVTLQEVEGCGSKRPIDCTLNARFSRKKIVSEVK